MQSSVKYLKIQKAQRTVPCDNWGKYNKLHNNTNRLDIWLGKYCVYSKTVHKFTREFPRKNMRWGTMKIKARKVTTGRSIEAAMKILRSSAVYQRKVKFASSSFSFFCVRWHSGRSIRIIPVRGSMSEESNQVTVMLEIHADMTFYIGCIIAILGTLSTLYMAIIQKPLWYMYCLIVLFGGIVSCSSLLVASEILDRLEFKLRD